MTSNLATPETSAAQAAGISSYLDSKRGLGGWLFTRDHKRVGVLYLIGISLVFLVGGALAMMAQMAASVAEAADSAGTVNAALHGSVMIFLFAVPAIPAVLGNFALPIMVGAKGVMFPRLNLASFYLWLQGAILVFSAGIVSSVDTGGAATPVALIGLGIFTVGLSSLLSGLNILATIHCKRAPSMSWSKMPMFVWGSYAGAILQVLATPMLLLAMALMISGSTSWTGVLVASQGDPSGFTEGILSLWYQPAAYIMILPAIGVVTDVISVNARKRVYGAPVVAAAMLAMAAFSLLAWGGHLFTARRPESVVTVSSFLSLLIAAPAAAIVFSWLATLWRGSISLTAPMLFALCFVVTFTIGGLASLFLAIPGVGVYLKSTPFAVAQSHYVMMGAAALGLLVGLHHWWPKMFGRTYSTVWSKAACAQIFAGIHLAFIPMLLAGSQGMARQNATHMFEEYGQVASRGMVVLWIGLAATATYLLHSLFAGSKASRNPWAGVTLEWKTSSPPPEGNFDADPVAPSETYNYSDLTEGEMVR